MFATAKAPNRATASITLSWGLMSVPVSLYTSTEQIRVARKEFHNGDPDKPIGRAPVLRGTETVVPTSEVTRMATATSGAVVPLGDDEVADVLGHRNGSADIEAFIPADQTSAYLADGDVYQVRAKSVKGVVDAAGDKALALLLAALSARNVVAYVKFVMRGSLRHGLLRADGMMVTVRPANAVREARDLPTTDVSDAELDMALTLLDAVGTSVPELIDDSPVKVQELIDAKAEGVDAPTPIKPGPMNADIMEALTASVEAAKAARNKEGAA